MVQHVNFYETLQEARMRLDETIVLYDGLPYHVLCICDHRSDGIFRVYLDPVHDMGKPFHRVAAVPYSWHDEPQMSKGQKMDAFMAGAGDSSPILRKMMNSPKFNKFRPFRLGMLNTGGRALYVERSPTRHTQQGLTGSGLTAKAFDLDGLIRPNSSERISVFTPGLYSTIVGNYPDLDLTLANLTDPNNGNTSVAFHSDFAIVRGTLNILFMSYKGDIVGYLPYNNTNEVKIGPDYSYLKEAVDELACFNAIS